MGGQDRVHTIKPFFLSFPDPSELEWRGRGLAPEVVTVSLLAPEEVTVSLLAPEVVTVSLLAPKEVTVSLLVPEVAVVSLLVPEQTREVRLGPIQ